MLPPVTLLEGIDFTWDAPGGRLALEITEVGHAKLAAAGYTGIIPVTVDVTETINGVAPWVTVTQDLQVGES